MKIYLDRECIDLTSSFYLIHFQRKPSAIFSYCAKRSFLLTFIEFFFYFLFQIQFYIDMVNIDEKGAIFSPTNKQQPYNEFRFTHSLTYINI